MTPQQQKDYDRHQTSLNGSAEFARQVKRYMREMRITDYAAAAREYQQKLEDDGIDLLYVATFGIHKEQADDKRVFAWQEADDLLMTMTKNRMEKTGESYSEARRVVEEDPVNLELVKSYTQTQ